MSEHSSPAPMPKRRTKRSNGDDRARRNFAYAIAGIIMLVWAASMAADAYVDGYSPPPAIHGAMTMVCTAMFGTTMLAKRNGNGN